MTYMYICKLTFTILSVEYSVQVIIQSKRLEFQVEHFLSIVSDPFNTNSYI